MIVDPEGILRGIFTDSDLARLFESRRDEALDGPIRQVMTKRPTTVPTGSMVSDAVEIMAERKISEISRRRCGGKAGRIDRYYRHRRFVSRGRFSRHPNR